MQADCNAAACFTPKLDGDKGTKASLTGTDVTGDGSALLSLKLGVNPLSSTGCIGYTPPGGRTGNDYYEFRLFQAEADTTFVMQYSKAAMGKRTPSSLEACFAAPGPVVRRQGRLPRRRVRLRRARTEQRGLRRPAAELLRTIRRSRACRAAAGSPGGGAAITVFVPRLWSGDPRCT